MKHEVNWDIDIINKFIKFGELNDEQIKIMRLRSSDHSDIEIASECNFSIPTYYRRVKELKKIYDKVQHEHPEMPERKLLNETCFNFYCFENAAEMLKYIDFNKFKIEVKIVKK